MGSLTALSRVTSQARKYHGRFCSRITQWGRPGPLRGLVALPREEGRVGRPLSEDIRSRGRLRPAARRRLAEPCFHAFVPKQVRTRFAGISVTSGSLPSSRKAPPPRTGSPGPRPRGSWSAAQTTSEGAGATSAQTSTAAPPSHSRRKGPRRKPCPRGPSRPLRRNRPCWSAG